VVMVTTMSPYIQFISGLWPLIVIACLAPIAFALPILLRTGRQRGAVARGMFRMYGVLTIIGVVVVAVSVLLVLFLSNTR
jgi:hypothetical protein